MSLKDRIVALTTQNRVIPKASAQAATFWNTVSKNTIGTAQFNALWAGPGPTGSSTWKKFIDNYLFHRATSVSPKDKLYEKSVALDSKLTEVEDESSTFEHERRVVMILDPPGNATELLFIAWPAKNKEGDGMKAVMRFAWINGQFQQTK